MPPSTKKCSVCKKQVPIENFYKRSASKDGLAYRCIPCDITAGKAYREKHKERDRVNRKWERIKRVYGLDKIQYQVLWDSQGGLCPICGCELREGWTQNHHKNRAVVDHDHETGKVRGILCTMCNKGLVLLGDNIESIKRVEEYLKNADVH